MISALDRLIYSAKRCFDKTAIVYGERRISYASLLAAVKSSSAYLASLGVKKGDMVAICQRNSPSFLINFYAIMSRGACAAMLNWRLTIEELYQAVALTDASIVICDSNSLEAFLGKENDTDFLQSNRNLVPATEWGVALANCFCGFDTDTATDCDWVTPVEPDDAALVFFTGGSTGTPKAAVHSHESLANWHTSTLNNDWTVLSSDVTYNAAPLFHLGGMQIAYFTISVGATLVLSGDSFDAESALDTIASENVTQVNAIPQTLILSFREEIEHRKRELESVRVVLLLGGAIREEYIYDAFNIFPNTDIVHAYGMSELAATTIMRHTQKSFAEHHERRLSVGRIGLSSRIKLLDDTGRMVSDGVPGRVFGKADCMMKGYLHHEVNFDDEGYFDTGDIMLRDAQGYYYYVGRSKLMIKTGGENVYCNEVESVIRQNLAVFNCVVFGLPDEKWGEAVSAAVELKPGFALSAEQLINHCRERAAHYKQPRNVFIVDKLPINPAGKILIGDVLGLLGIKDQFKL